MKICGMCENKHGCAKYMIYGYASNYAESCKGFREGLRPCPFCGRRELDDVSVAEIPEKHYVGCPSCDIGFIRPTREDAVRKWNSRKR